MEIKLEIVFFIGKRFWINGLFFLSFHNAIIFKVAGGYQCINCAHPFETIGIFQEKKEYKSFQMLEILAIYNTLTANV